mgnify:CR=1 FL=1
MQYFPNVFMFSVMIVSNRDTIHDKENVPNVIQHSDNRTCIKFGWSKCIVSFLFFLNFSFFLFPLRSNILSSNIIIIIIIIFDRKSNCCCSLLFFFFFFLSLSLSLSFSIFFVFSLFECLPVEKKKNQTYKINAQR